MKKVFSFQGRSILGVTGCARTRQMAERVFRQNRRGTGYWRQPWREEQNESIHLKTANEHK